MSCLYASIMVTMIKTIGDDVSATVIVAGRCFFGLILLSPMLLPMLLKKGLAGLASTQLTLHLVRGGFVAVGINLGFYSLTILPITTVTVLFFTVPLFVTLLARPVLGEPVGWRRISATLVGFLGAIVVINPTTDVFDMRLLIPVVSSAFFSVSLVLHKQLSKSDPPWVLMFYMFSCTLVLTAPFSVAHWQTLELGNFGFIVLIAIFATLRTYADIKAYAIGDVSFVAPFQYLRILFVSIIAYILFSEVLSFHEWVGVMIIMSSTLYIAHREYRLNRHRVQHDRL